MAAGSKKLGVLSLAFKAGADDLCESPIFSPVEMLLGKGCQIVIHDRDVARVNIIGASGEYVEREIPHPWSLIRESTNEVIQSSGTIVIGNGLREYRDLGAALDGPWSSIWSAP